jgi:hypothetical protein
MRPCSCTSSKQTLVRYLDESNHRLRQDGAIVAPSSERRFLRAMVETTNMTKTGTLHDTFIDELRDTWLASQK